MSLNPQCPKESVLDVVETAVLNADFILHSLAEMHGQVLNNGERFNKFRPGKPFYAVKVMVQHTREFSKLSEMLAGAQACGIYPVFRNHKSDEVFPDDPSEGVPPEYGPDSYCALYLEIECLAKAPYAIGQRFYEPQS